MNLNEDELRAIQDLSQHPCPGISDKNCNLLTCQPQDKQESKGTKPEEKKERS
jgi:hypothetical protein